MRVNYAASAAVNRHPQRTTNAFLSVASPTNDPDVLDLIDDPPFNTLDDDDEATLSTPLDDDDDDASPTYDPDVLPSQAYP